MTNRIVVIAAHPDDEVIGVGGTLTRHVDDGDEVHIIIVAEGATSRNESSNLQKKNREVSELQLASNAAAQIIGAQTPIFLGLPDNRLDSLQFLDVVQLLEGHIKKIDPHIIYTHHAGDLNIDHKLVNAAVVTSCRPMNVGSMKALYAFETVSSTEWNFGVSRSIFEPNHFVDISNSLERKIEALSCYEKEMREFPHPRSHEAIESLSRVRGSTVGFLAAEAFMTMWTRN